MQGNTMQTFCIHEIYKDDRQLVIAVEVIHSQQYATAMGCAAWLDMKPIAVVVCSGGETCLVHIQGQSTSVDQLRHEIPALDLAIKSFNGSGI